jgi:hypothetical protein
VGHKQKRMMRDQAFADFAQANPRAAETLYYIYLGCFIFVAALVVLCIVGGYAFFFLYMASD